MTEEMFFCVDAGATRSRGCLYNARAEVVAYAEDGPANASYDLDQVVCAAVGVGYQRGQATDAGRHRIKFLGCSNGRVQAEQGTSMLRPARCEFQEEYRPLSSPP